uniref:Uncharacterized protein n=1 Tax=Arundo donax TaxID=35708 RepID=A0A0A9B297_ARUDO
MSSELREIFPTVACSLPPSLIMLSSLHLCIS